MPRGFAPCHDGVFFSNILLVQTLNSYLTFLTLAECSDDISLSSFQGPKDNTLGMANLGPVYAQAALFSTRNLSHFSTSSVACPFSCSLPADEDEYPSAGFPGEFSVA